MVVTTATQPPAVSQEARELVAKLLGYRDWADATDYRLTGEQDRKRDEALELIAAFEQRIRSVGEEEEAYEIGKRDGYESAVQDIDMLTGGDGEYFASTIPGRGCPDPDTMKRRIVDRFEALSTPAAEPAPFSGPTDPTDAVWNEWLAPYRSMDAGGGDEAAGAVGFRWINDLAIAEAERDPDGLTVESAGSGYALYRGTDLLAVATSFRDPMNFTVLMRWKSAALSIPAAEPEKVGAEQALRDHLRKISKARELAADLDRMADSVVSADPLPWFSDQIHDRLAGAATLLRTMADEIEALRGERDDRADMAEALHVKLNERCEIVGDLQDKLVAAEAALAKAREGLTRIRGAFGTEACRSIARATLADLPRSSDSVETGGVKDG